MKRTAVIICVLLLLLLAGCGTKTEPQEPAVNGEINQVEKTEDLHAKITVAGDLVLHTTLVNQSHVSGNDYDFTPLFEDVAHYVDEADYSICCFEGALAESGYQGYPMFLVPDGLASSLKSVGFDLIATASNHALDGGKAGIDRTLDVLDENGLDHVGTYRSQEEWDAQHGILFKDINGIKIAFLDYTYGTNGMPVGKYPYAINLFYTDYMDSSVNMDCDRIVSDLEYAKSQNPDLIAVIAHWGNEYITSKQPVQEKMAEYLFKNGADLILGGHPHVPQPMELVKVTDNEGREKTGFICYCLGNLLANMKETDHKDCTLTAMVQIDISKNIGTGETVINNVGYIPMMMTDTMDLGITGTDWRFRVWDINSAISDYESGNDRDGIITESLYKTMLQYHSDLEQIMGTTLEMEK